ncbi:exocyst complex component EXO70H1 [Salvia miltiorrhiza]|uniref:exocyst complex component EXO70H1 n=1 Tax=Salvia miltiorrhiza TaxID=226208 RepID=UPI0025AC265A|nr:exocyst complex component EXO70H1 [Salvia miltiorrhiza]
MKIRIFSSNVSDHSSLQSHHHHRNSAAPSSATPRPRSLSEIMAEECISCASYLIRKWQVDAGKFGTLSSLFLSDREEAEKLLEATIGLQRAMKYHVKLSTTSDELVGAQALMQIAMQRLKFEFYAILSANRNDCVSENRESAAAAAAAPRPASESERAVEDLKSVAECMIACGYGKECVNIYRIVRKSIVDEAIYCLGIERLSSAQLKKMEWTALETRIQRWLSAVNIVVRKLFYREKVICDAVFSSSKKIAEACFAAVSRDAAADLFAFAENVCNCKKLLSPEKVFRLLDIYEAISDFWPDIEFIFSDKLSSAQMKLRETVRAMLGQFEEAIRKDSAQPPPGGGVHPLTRYVMNFLEFLGDYAAAVSNILQDSPLKVRSPASGGDEISRRLSWLILVLLCKLDGKAAAYDDVALSYLYLANNLNYVVSKARNSNLGILIGKNWIREHEAKVQTYLANYERIGWSNVISAVPENPAAVTPPSKVREFLELFYVSFEDACRKQRSWVIPDPKIREGVKISLAKRILSGYRVLCKQGKRVGLIVRYTPEDLDNYLADLFKA